MEATFITATEQQVFPACWCGHQVMCMAGQMRENRLQDLAPSHTPTAQNLLVTLKSGNFSEHVSLWGRGTQPSCCHAAQWLFRAQADIWASTSWRCNAFMQEQQRKEVIPAGVKCETCCATLTNAAWQVGRGNQLLTGEIELNWENRSLLPLLKFRQNTGIEKS